MKPDIVITGKGHAGTMATLEQEFSAHKLFEAPDKDLFLKNVKDKARALEPSARCRSTAS